MFSYIFWGLICGALAKWILPGKQPGGIIATMLIGIAGAFVGGFIARMLGLGSFSGFSIWGIVLATFGAVVLLAAYGFLTRKE